MAAIQAADVVGYSRHMGQDEVGARRQFNAHFDLGIAPAIARYHGRLVKTMGDGVLVEFASAVDAVRCAVEFQAAFAENNAGLPTPEKMSFRVGANLGDVIVEGDDIHGDGVNVAARLEGLAKPGGIVISGIVREIVRARVAFEFDDLGAQAVKNIEEPLRAYRVRRQAGATPARDDRPDGAPTPPAPPPIADKPSVVVLPFANNSDDPDQEYFADGITDDLITDLSKSPGLLVTARNSSFAFKGKPHDPREVARRLGVRHVLEGSVRRAGNRIRINAQLVEGSSGNQVWADRYDEALDHILPVVAQVPRFIPAKVQLARTYSEMGRPADAAAVARSILEMAPRYRIDSAARMFPYPTVADRTRLTDGLRAAGLPE